MVSQRKVRSEGKTWMKCNTPVPIAEAFLEIILIKLESRISEIQGRVEFWNSNGKEEILSSVARKAYLTGRFYEGEFWTVQYSLLMAGP